MGKIKDIIRDIHNLRDEQYLKAMEGVKYYIQKYGEKKNPFVDNISFDISGYDIEYTPACTFDVIYYIPNKDELGFIIYKEYTDEIFITREFKRGDVDDVYTILINLYQTHPQEDD